MAVDPGGERAVDVLLREYVVFVEDAALDQTNQAFRHLLESPVDQGHGFVDVGLHVFGLLGLEPGRGFHEAASFFSMIYQSYDG